MKHILYLIGLLLCLPLLGLGQSSGTGPFSLTAPSAATANVQWYKNGVAISGATATTISAATQGVYWASYDVTTPSSCSGLVTAYNVVIQEGDAGAKTLTGPAGQTAYQWYKDGAVVSGATSAALSLPNTTSAVGTYYLSYNNGSCVLSTSNFYVYVLLAPPTIAITSPVNITTTSTNPPISGTATALASVTVNAPNGQVCLTTANASGAWTCSSLTFTVGAQTVTAIASNTAGVSNTATTNFTVVAPALVPPTIAITSPVNITTTSTNPPISGTATALASVTVNAPNGQVCLTTANASGAWTCSSLTFTVGAQTVTAIASNTAGVSTTATTNFTVVAPALVPPTIAITSPANVTTTSTNPPISGTATALASVTVNAPNGQVCLTTANASGAWTCSSLTFTVGAQTVTAIASNTAGVSTTATTNFTVVSGVSCPNPSVGGSVALVGTLPLCSVSNGGSLNLTGNTGSVVKWQTSTNGGTTWTDVANTTTSLSFTNAANNQQYRVVVNNAGSCADATSSPVTITTSASACSANCTVLPGTIAR